MTEKLLAVIFVFINSVISATGYAGVMLLMAIESACIPLPSELIMPFAGYLVFTGHSSCCGWRRRGRSDATWDRWWRMRLDAMAGVRWWSATGAGF